MKKIVGMVRPFDAKQTFYVYEDGNVLGVKTPSLENITEDILSLAKEFNVNRIDLAGPKQFNHKIVKDIQKEEFLKYNKNSLEINLI